MTATTRKAVSSREIEALRARIYALPFLAKCELLESLRLDLAGNLGAESEVTKETRLRAEALEAMGKVAEHLGLEAEMAPTTTQFDEAARELGLDWTVSKVTRTWEKWRLATDAYKGKLAPAVPASRAKCRQLGRRLTEEECLDRVRAWLETKPERRRCRLTRSSVTHSGRDSPRVRSRRRVSIPCDGASRSPSRTSSPSPAARGVGRGG